MLAQDERDGVQVKIGIAEENIGKKAEIGSSKNFTDQRMSYRMQTMDIPRISGWLPDTSVLPQLNIR
ncbi:hypothetical protein C5O19_18635 [Siphonobacter curvatus]|uniref:Uncharacterized protein n=1 Tax=Siphonobacter curvatus TaxID=2094562 RepID=A0A2S7IJA2_9BACT|nr:hypothetical protein C5O19_18635 [Siphonobacter curvatus]